MKNLVYHLLNVQFLLLLRVQECSFLFEFLAAGLAGMLRQKDLSERQISTRCGKN